MMYRQRNQDGLLGDWVYTPAGEEERKQEEALQKEMEALRKENAKLKKAQKGGGENGVV
ncbi:hypothetical protein [Brevibacillus brevis]|uniref:hypothetical protein n=1 Tax=Brevibacillus brevis TaxID=1393 RepID=UPI00163D0217|nr:hypothetical protein [Lysinibacillus sp. SDF0063]